MKVRGGVFKIRCLAAPHDAEVSIELHIAESADTPATWQYTLGFLECSQTHQHTYITHERVWKGDELLLRPDNFDKDDLTRLTQTALEQSATNAKFREISSFLRNVTYLHLVPQFIQYADAIQGKIVEEDPFGQMFLDRIASVHPSTRRSRLKKNRTCTQNCHSTV